MNQSHSQLNPIGVISSCYKQKFGIPRQPGLVSSANAVLTLLEPYKQEDYIRGLEGFSHIWLIFHFHQSKGRIKATVRPPRLGGNRRLGVFATRSNFRPNGLGLSVVKLESILSEGKETHLYLSGVDVVDGTPVYDIKPYLSYADSIPNALGGFADAKPEAKLRVEFSPQAMNQCELFVQSGYQHLILLITQTLALDPRPAYKHEMNDDRVPLEFSLLKSVFCYCPRISS